MFLLSYTASSGTAPMPRDIHSLARFWRRVIAFVAERPLRLHCAQRTIAACALRIDLPLAHSNAQHPHERYGTCSVDSQHTQWSVLKGSVSHTRGSVQLPPNVCTPWRIAPDPACRRACTHLQSSTPLRWCTLHPACVDIHRPGSPE